MSEQGLLDMSRPRAHLEQQGWLGSENEYEYVGGRVEIREEMVVPHSPSQHGICFSKTNLALKFHWTNLIFLLHSTAYEIKATGREGICQRPQRKLGGW